VALVSADGSTRVLKPELQTHWSGAFVGVLLCLGTRCCVGSALRGCPSNSAAFRRVCAALWSLLRSRGDFPQAPAGNESKTLGNGRSPIGFRRNEAAAGGL